MTICEDETKELDCGEDRAIHILEGTNYGHLDSTTCQSTPSTGSDTTALQLAPATATTIITTTTMNSNAASNAGQAVGSNGASNVGQEVGSNIGSNAGKAVGSNSASNAAQSGGTVDITTTTTTTSAAAIASTTTDEAITVDYIQCKAKNSKEKVEEL